MIHRGVFLVLLSLIACGDDLPQELDLGPTWRMEIAPCWNVRVASGDLNGDDRADLVIIRGSCSSAISSWRGPGEIAVHAGLAEGFSAEPVLLLSLSSLEVFEHRTVHVLDADGDGLHDILIRDLTTSRFAESQTMHLGSESWEAIARPMRTLGGNISYPIPTSPLVGDIDGDGRDELIEARDGYVFVREWDASVPEWVNSVIGEGDAVSWNGDVNGDGAPDVVVELSGKYRTLFGCPDTTCRVGQTLPDQALPDVGSIPFGVDDINGDGRAELVSYSVGNALRMHLSNASGEYALEPDWQLAPDSVDGRLAPRHADDFNRDGRSNELLIASDTRTMLFEAVAGGATPRAIFEWRGYRAIDSAPWDESLMLFLKSPDREDVSVWLEGFGKGTVPSGTPVPLFEAEFSCNLRDVDAADITVDQGLIAQTVDIHYEEFAEDSCVLVEGCVGAPGRRKLLDFSVAVQNLGGGIATIPGPSIRPEIWHADECHGHDHLTGFASYDLLNSAGESFVAGHKQGYYIIDVFPHCDLESVAPAPWDSPTGSFSISPGWSDIYYAGLDCQWIDITDVPDGHYTLQVIVNANGIIVEDDVLPNTALVNIEILGDEVHVR
ncbi:MAG: hypothetical protein JKY56_20700 [Kofleriaceae bacterium]|nr:hypothetical protein [Kofleriaceae bacterium]